MPYSGFEPETFGVSVGIAATEPLRSPPLSLNYKGVEEPLRALFRQRVSASFRRLKITFIAFEPP